MKHLSTAGAPVKGGKGKDDKTKRDVTPMIQGVVFDRSSALKTSLQVDRASEQVSHEKNPPTSHYTGWLIGILIIVYYNLYITG